MMNAKASFFSLVYREYALTKKGLLIAIIGVGVFAVFGLLVALSMRIGNLSTAPDEVRTLFPFAKYMGLMGTALFGAEGCTLRDVQSCTWGLFRRSSPVRPARLALAKYTYFLLGLTASAAMLAVYLLAYSAVSGDAINSGDIALFVLAVFFFRFMAISSDVFILLTGSYDKGGLAAVGTCALVVYALSFLLSVRLYKRSLQNAET